MTNTITTTTTTSISPNKTSLFRFFDILELTAEIAQHLFFYQYTQCAIVSKAFYNGFQPLVWKHFDSPLDIPSFDPSLIRRNVPYIQMLSLSVMDHDVLPMLTDTLPQQSIASPSLFFREQVSASVTGKENSIDEAEETPFTTTLPSSLPTLSSIMSYLHVNNQSRCTNLTRLSFSDNVELSLKPKQHLLFHANILTLLLNSPYITTLHIPADLFAFRPQLFFNTLQHRLRRLEELALGPVISKAYTYFPSSALDRVDLGLDNNSDDNDEEENNNSDKDNIATVITFSGVVDWEMTVQLLETCLWKRQTNKENAFLIHLRCRYTIPDNMYTVPESVLQSQLLRLSPLYSSLTYYRDQVDGLEEPRITYLVLPSWRFEQSEQIDFKYSYYSLSEPYSSGIVLSLLEQLPYLTQLMPYSWVKRLSEGEYDDDDDVVINDGDSDDNDDGNAESSNIAHHSRGHQESSSSRKEKEDLRPRYRWREIFRSYRPDRSDWRCQCEHCIPLKPTE
ncbi:hypothetical protein BG015_002056 [Linnemannia schmuckeri]|uniref:Uncharacterized protein n=1 Tax=Linnemannia schmuckeri TaxID=64567 RepID=A0A9P5RSE1_9FUNG|nr:hypothetical protein BG015_002056 [Linnemannia schmuckeri]